MTDAPDPRSTMEKLLAGGDFDGVLACAAELHPDSVPDSETLQWLFTQARGWHSTGLLEQQRAVCELMLAFKSDHYEALHLLGHAAQAEGDFARAEFFYTQALAAKPDYAFARLALAQLRMLKSGFTQGRDQYEARFDAVTEGSGPDWRGLPLPRWHGEPLAGRKIYLWPEQGLGDIAMFAGFLPYLLAQKPARVALGMFPKLMTLFTRSFPDIDVEPADDAVHQALAPTIMTAYPQIEKLSQLSGVPFSLAPLKSTYEYVRQHGLFDYAAPLADMMVYGLPEYVPAGHSSGYLKADPQRVDQIRARLHKAGKGKLVGIAWHTTNRREWMRNIPLETWVPLLANEQCHFISLQHGVPREEIEAFCKTHDCRITVDEHTDLLADAEGLAALVAAMDHVITIDNSTIHLAGAMNVPATLLLPRGHNFRWPERAGNGTLWYSGVRVLRQRTPGEWNDVMQEAASEI